MKTSIQSNVRAAIDAGTPAAASGQGCPRPGGGPPVIDVPDRDEMYAPTVVVGDDTHRRGINIGIRVTVTRNGKPYAAGTVTALGHGARFELDHGRVIVPHDPGPGIRQVVHVTYPDQ